MARNERLLTAMQRAGKTTGALADALAVDPKTVERWVVQGRRPYPRHRMLIAEMLDEPAEWIWPDTSIGGTPPALAESEVMRVYSHRAQITPPMWTRLFATPTTTLDVLVYAGLFLPEQTPGLCDELAERSRSGVRVRMLLGDPDCEAVRVRGVEEGIGDAVAIKIRNALALYERLVGSPVQIRLHASTLYTSIYRFDDQMIANPHVLGLPAAQSPALHLRRVKTGELFDTYAATFERLWESARPAWD